jgi:hypothetical protein
VPKRALGLDAFGMAFASMALAQVHLAMGDHGLALNLACQALVLAAESRGRLEEGAATVC